MTNAEYFFGLFFRKNRRGSRKSGQRPAPVFPLLHPRTGLDPGSHHQREHLRLGQPVAPDPDPALSGFSAIQLLPAGVQVRPIDIYRYLSYFCHQSPRTNWLRPSCKSPFLLSRSPSILSIKVHRLWTGSLKKHFSDEILQEILLRLS